MASLKINRGLVPILSLILVSCVTSSYRANKPNALGTDIEVTPDRVVTECEFIDNYSGEHKSPFGFLIHILDDEKTVITASNPAVLEGKDCRDRQKEVDRIIKNAHLVFIRGRGDAEYPRLIESHSIYFPRHGKFPHNGRSLNYLAIWNERGQCYDAFSGTQRPCPGK